MRKDAEKRLNERHPDFEDIRNSDDFHSMGKRTTRFNSEMDLFKC